MFALVKLQDHEIRGSKSYTLCSLFSLPEATTGGLQAYKFIKKRLQRRRSPVGIAKLLRTPTLKNICEWLHYVQIKYY